MEQEKKQGGQVRKRRKTKLEILEEGLPHFEQFIEAQARLGGHRNHRNVAAVLLDHNAGLRQAGQQFEIESAGRCRNDHEEDDLGQRIRVGLERDAFGAESQCEG